MRGLRAGLPLALAGSVGLGGDGLAARSAPGWIGEALAADGGRASETTRLLDARSVTLVGVREVDVTHRTATRVMEKRAIEAASFCSVGYGGGTRLVSLDAWTVAPDGRTTRASRRRASDHPAFGESLYEDYRIRILRAPEVRLGAIVACESRVARSDLGAAMLPLAELPWPLALGRLDVHLGTSRSGEVVTIGPVTAEVEESPGELSAVVRSVDAALPVDGGGGPDLWVRWWDADGTVGFRDWSDVGRWYHALAEPVLGASPRRIDAVGVDRWRPALDAAFERAAREVRYVSIQIGIGGYRPSPPEEVWERRYGDCKDKTFLMRSLLESDGFETFAVLVRTRGSGRLYPELPTPGQFDHAILGVRVPDGADRVPWPTARLEGIGRVLFVDPTSRFDGVDQLRSDVQGTRALVVLPDGGVLVDLPVRPAAEAEHGWELTVRIDDAGRIVSGRQTRSWRAGDALDRRAATFGATAAEVRREAESHLAARFPGARVLEFEVEESGAAGGAVVESIEFTGGRMADRVGDRLWLRTRAATRGSLSAAGLPEPPVEHAHTMGPPRTLRLELTIELPDGWTIDELPAGSALDTSELRASSSWRREPGRLTYRRTAARLTYDVPADRYAAFHADWLALRAGDGRPIELLPVDR